MTRLLFVSDFGLGPQFQYFAPDGDRGKKKEKPLKINDLPSWAVSQMTWLERASSGLVVVAGAGVTGSGGAGDGGGG